MTMQSQKQEVERWGVFELALKGPDGGNPFIDVELRAVFRCGDTEFSARGFYDGDGTYRVRCMPTVEGEWEVRTESDCEALDGKTAQFVCVAPSPANHGPVRVADTYHFAHADGTRHISIGTTCYAWLHQPIALQERTLATLADAPFNKLRMCVFPKNYTWCKNEPEVYPYAKTPEGDWDFTRFHPAFFRHFEQRIAQLAELGIEADIILFHPYDFDRWGFDRYGADLRVTGMYFGRGRRVHALERDLCHVGALRFR